MKTNIFEGVGIENIAVDKSSKADVIAKFGESYRLIEHNTYSFQISYEKLGLSFYYRYEDPQEKIFSIHLESPFIGMTAKGIVLGESTMQDVIDSYGQAAWRTTDESETWWAEYPGIRFHVEAALPRYPLNEKVHIKKTIVKIGLLKINLLIDEDARKPNDFFSGAKLRMQVKDEKEKQLQMRAEIPLEFAMSELMRKPVYDSVRSTRKYRVEKKSYTLDIYDRKSGTKVFSNTVDNDPCYCYDRPDYGEAPVQKYFNAHAVSPDDRYVLLAYVGSIPNDDYTSTKYSYFRVFEIETGKCHPLDFEYSRSVINVDFTSDGKHIIASYIKDDNLIALAWDFETGKIVMETEGPRPKTAGSEKPPSDAETKKS